MYPRLDPIFTVCFRIFYYYIIVVIVVVHAVAYWCPL